MTDSQQPATDIGEFHLMRGGLVHKTMRRLRLQGEENHLVYRRSLILILITWLPLLVLSSVQGLLLPREGVSNPFLYDFPTHVAFLVMVPLLVIAESFIEPSLAGTVRSFLDRGIIKEQDLEAFSNYVAWAQKKCRSHWPELFLGLFALLPIFYPVDAFELNESQRFTWSHKILNSWFVLPNTDDLSLAGIWALLVSGFLARLLIYRWLWRIFIWTRLLHKIASLDLNTYAIHPDRSGGLAFVGGSLWWFGILSFAIGSATSANIAADILFDKTQLADEKYVVLAYIFVSTITLMLPVVTFVGVLFRTRQRGQREYGNFVSNYLQGFHNKWVKGEGGHGNPDPLTETQHRQDVQTLAALGSSASVMYSMKFLPIGQTTIFFVALCGTVPMLPLILLDPWAFQVAKDLLSRLL